MFYTIMLIAIVITQSGGSEREEKTPAPIKIVHLLRIEKAQLPSRFELKEEYFIVTAYITCDAAPLDTPPTPLPGRWGKVEHIVLTGCSPPAPPDPPALAQALTARGAVPLNITHIQLKDVPPDARFNASHFEGFDSVVSLAIQAAGEGHQEQLDSDFLQSLPNTGWLTLENEIISPFPNKTHVHDLKLTRGRSMGPWGECRALSHLNLKEWRVPTGVWPAGGWLAKCKNIRYLRAERMDLKSLQTVLSGLSSQQFTNLALPNNSLTRPDLLTMLKTTVDNILVLHVMNNNLTDIDNVLETQTRLLELDLSHNLVNDFIRTVRAIFASIKLRYSVRKLLLDHNPLQDYCKWTYNPWLMFTGRTPPLNLELLSLVGTNTSRFCFPDWNLRHLNLSTNNIEELQFGQLPLIGNVKTLEVDLRHNPLREVHFNESNYNALTDVHRPRSELVTVHTDPLPLFDCNCKNAWLARALREGRVVLPAGALCHGGGELHARPPDSLECDLQPCEPCSCRRRWKPPTVIMQCDALGLHAIPSLPDLGEAHLKGNHINTIQAEDLATTLTLLDVRNNNISRVDEVVAEKLFEVLERRVWLAGNPLACDCDNWPLIDALQAHRVQVEDYQNVTCSNGHFLRDVREEQLCSAIAASPWMWVATVGGVLLGLLALLLAMYLRYERQLKVWLFARGWCLSCVHEEELDADREYDAFLSFAHGDFEFVTSQLLPELEDGPHGYKICVHYRDWIPGEMIPTQITRSVASSRRTVIVLSANFVQSMWGIMEFRAAHVSALAEGRVRVLVVALEDAPPTEVLPEELRLYLRSTTYLRWDDPWFWKKLRYALPHRDAGRDRRTEIAKESTRETMPPSNAFEMVLYEQ